MTEEFEETLFDKTDMSILEKGGQEAIVCFMKLSRKLFDAGGEDALRAFVVQVIPLLPARERSEIVVLLSATLLNKLDNPHSSPQRSARFRRLH